MELDNLYEIYEYLNNDLREMNERVKSANGKLNNDTLSYIDKLTHAIKSVKTTIAMEEAKNGYSERRYSRDGSYDGGSYDGGSYGGSYDGNSYYSRNSYNSYGGSYERGRGSNAKRDSMGRYSSERGYSRDGDKAKEDTIRKLTEFMERTNEPNVRSEIQSYIREFERM